MPFGDRTGPRGLGPMTGGRRGYCAGYDVPGSMNPWPGRGVSMGGGGGRGARHRYWYYATGLPGWARAGYGPVGEAPSAYGPSAAPTQEQQTMFLEQQANQLKEQLRALEEQISALKRGSEKDAAKTGDDRTP